MVSGDIISVVNATGTIKPVSQIAVGSFVSGPIDAEFQLTDRHGRLLFDKYGPRLTMPQLSEVLHISVGTIHNQISAGNCHVKTYLDGGKRFADCRDVAEFLDSMRALAA